MNYKSKSAQKMNYELILKTAALTYFPWPKGAKNMWYSSTKLQMESEIERENKTDIWIPVLV